MKSKQQPLHIHHTFLYISLKFHILLGMQIPHDNLIVIYIFKLGTGPYNLIAGEFAYNLASWKIRGEV